MRLNKINEAAARGAAKVNASYDRAVKVGASHDVALQCGARFDDVHGQRRTFKVKARDGKIVDKPTTASLNGDASLARAAVAIRCAPNPRKAHKIARAMAKRLGLI